MQLVYVWSEKTIRQMYLNLKYLSYQSDIENKSFKFRKVAEIDGILLLHYAFVGKTHVLSLQSIWKFTLKVL